MQPYICVNQYDAGSTNLVVINARYIRSIHQTNAKTMDDGKKLAGVQSCLLMQYGDLEISIVYVIEHISVLANMLDAVGRPQ
ncbi:hypothetical protein [Achromobacter phage nyashin_LB6]|nr:hypothetical protein [Achromobacter phage nyashin_LB6]